MQQPQQKPDAGSNYSSKMGQKTIIRVRENTKAVERQEKIFTNWINFILRQRGLQISSVLRDLDDGLILIQLAEILIGKNVTAFERNPKLMAQRLSNISIALKFFADNHVRCTVGPKSIASNDEKTILGFIWLLIRQFQLKSSSDSVAAGRLSSAREEDLDVLERELRRAIAAAETQLAAPAAAPAPASAPAPQPQQIAPARPTVAVVESEKKSQREKIKEKPAIKDGTHSSVVSDQTLRSSKWLVKPAQLEDTCNKCEQPIADATMIQIESGASYHVSCFACQACSAPFEDIYWEHDGKALCEKHYLERAGKKCAKCSEFISGPLVKAMHQNWHVSCFVCTTCEQPFEGDYCTISGKPYCKQDYYRKKGWLCAKCDKLVGKGDKSALGKAWHKGCFVCTKCEAPFGKEGFFNIGGRPYCPTHYRERIPAGNGN